MTTSKNTSGKGVWSVEVLDSEKTTQGGSHWWNKLLKLNRTSTSSTHPYLCALNCGYKYTSSSANAKDQ